MCLFVSAFRLLQFSNTTRLFSIEVRGANYSLEDNKKPALKRPAFEKSFIREMRFNPNLKIAVLCRKLSSTVVHSRRSKLFGPVSHRSDIKIRDVQSVVLNEFTAWFHFIAHQFCKNCIGVLCIANFDLQK